MRTRRKAAEAVAGYDNRLMSIKSRLTLLQWMVGFNLAISVAIAMRVLFD